MDKATPTPSPAIAAIMHNVRELRVQTAMHTGESTGNLDVLERRIEDGIRVLAGLHAVQPELPEVERLAAQAAPSEEMSPEFTDTARAALLWVLWHHQGGSSKVGQPIRFALGMEQHQPLSEYQVREAQRWEAMAPTRDTANVPPGEWNSEPEGLTPKQAWWAGYRVGKGLPPDMSRSEAVAAQPSQAPVVQAVPENCGTGYCSCIECVVEPEAVQTEVRFKYESMKPIDGYDAIYAAMVAHIEAVQAKQAA